MQVEIINNDILTGYLDKGHSLIKLLKGENFISDIRLGYSKIKHLSNDIISFVNSLQDKKFKRVNIIDYFEKTAPEDCNIAFHNDLISDIPGNYITLIIYINIDSTIEDGGTLIDVSGIDINESSMNNKLIPFEKYYSYTTDEEVKVEKLLSIDCHGKDDKIKFVLFNSALQHSGNVINGSGRRDVIVMFCGDNDYEDENIREYI